MGKESYFVIRCKDGEVFRKNGLFYGRSEFRQFAKLKTASESASMNAKYYRETMRVDSSAGETLATFGPDGAQCEVNWPAIRGE